MARPPRPRRIPADLEGLVLKPRGVPYDPLRRRCLTLDGLEALRLTDVEGLYQEEAARRMGVSRPTFGRILVEARRAVAEALVGGLSLEIAGGPVTRRAPRGHAGPCPVHGAGRRRGRRCRCGARRRERTRGGGRAARRTDPGEGAG